MPLSERNLDRARKLLADCKTLADADEALKTLTPPPSRAFRWGCWDSWAGRERSLDGLVCDKRSPLETEEGRRRAALDYDEGFKAGRQLLRDAERTPA